MLFYRISLTPVIQRRTATASALPCHDGLATRIHFSIWICRRRNACMREEISTTHTHTEPDWLLECDMVAISCMQRKKMYLIVLNVSRSRELSWCVRWVRSKYSYFYHRSGAQPKGPRRYIKLGEVVAVAFAVCSMTRPEIEYLKWVDGTVQARHRCAESRKNLGLATPETTSSK